MNRRSFFDELQIDYLSGPGHGSHSIPTYYSARNTRSENPFLPDIFLLHPMRYYLYKVGSFLVSTTLLNKTVCVVGLGYVGLPLSEAFSKHLRIIGYRRNQKAVDELNASPGNKIEATTDPSMIKQADFVIIGVPTPVTKAKDPDLKPVESASKIVGQNLKKGAIVVLESTVYPGVTEEIMGPIIAR